MKESHVFLQIDNFRSRYQSAELRAVFLLAAASSQTGASEITFRGQACRGQACSKQIENSRMNWCEGER